MRRLKHGRQFQGRRQRAGYAALFASSLCLAAVGCGRTTIPPDQRTGPAVNVSADLLPAAKGTDAAEPEKPTDFSLAAEELQAEFQKDKEAAEKKYKDKTIKLTGVVKAVYGDEPAFVGLVGGKEPLGLTCVMIEKEPWLRLAAGQMVTLRGSGTTDGGQPALYHCVIVDAGPNPAAVLTAAKLAEDYASDPEGVKKMYAGKPLILTGEVIENKNDDKGRVVRLKGAKGIGIELFYGPAFEKRGKNIQAGDTIKVFGDLTESYFFRESIGLNNPYAYKITKDR